MPEINEIKNHLNPRIEKLYVWIEQNLILSKKMTNGFMWKDMLFDIIINKFSEN